MTTHDAPTLELLLRHQSLVRSIARDLLADPAAADDVVQQTWLAALRHAARGADVGKSLLARIATNLAFNRRRDERRRETRERRAAVAEPLPSVAELVEREDERRRVVEAVFALHEPLRETVLRRYLDDRSEAEVATLLAIPLGTVRSRLRLARTILRERLGKDGDAPRSARGLAALAGWSADEAAAAIAGGKGVLVMGAKAWVGLAAGVAVIGILAWTSMPAASDDVSEAALPATGAALAGAEPDPAQSAAPSTTANATAAPPTRESITEDVAGLAAAARVATIRGRCVTPEGAPIVGAEVSSDSAAGPVVSDPQGRFVLEVSAEDRSAASDVSKATVRIAAADRATQTVSTFTELGKSIELGDIVLAPAGRIRGVVLDDAGLPVPALVQLRKGTITKFCWWSRVGTFHEFEEGLTTAIADASGRFAFDSLEEGWYSLLASTTGLTPLAVVPVAVRSSSDTDAVIRMRRPLASETLHGIALDDEGRPLPGAKVRWYFEYRSSNGSGSGAGDLLTDANGEWSVVAPPRTVHAFELEFADGRIAQACELHPGDPRIVLQNEPAKFAEVAIVDADTGLPCAGARVIVARSIPRPAASGTAKRPSIDEMMAAAKAAGEAQRTEDAAAKPSNPLRMRLLKHMMRSSRSTRFTTDATGTARIVIPRFPYEVRVELAAYDTATSGPFESETAPPAEPIRLTRTPVRTGSLAAQGIPVLHGTVTRDGLPVAGALVVLQEITVDDVSANSTTYVGRKRAIRSTASQADGSFELEIPKNLERRFDFRVRAECAGVAPVQVRIAPNDLESCGPLSLQMQSGGTIAGKVVTNDARSPAGLVVIASCDDGDFLWTRVDADHRFAFEQMLPQAWKLTVSATEPDPHMYSTRREARPGQTVLVESGHITNCDLVWSPSVGGTTTTLAGSIRLGGEPRYGTTAHLYAKHSMSRPREAMLGQQLATCSVGPSGSFRFDVPEPGSFVFEIRVAQGPNSDEIRLARFIEVNAGMNDLVLDLACGAVRGTCGHPSNGWVVVHGELDVGTDFYVRVAANADGSFTMPLVPAGRFSVAGSSDSKEIEVRVGETTTVELK